MKLRDRILENLAEMVVGDHPAFPYKSSFFITQFFKNCGFPFVHDKSTRRFWAADRLRELNVVPSQTPDLPADGILRVISELFNPDYFDGYAKNTPEDALSELNKVLAKQGLAAYFANSGRVYVRNIGSGADSTSILEKPRPLSPEEISQRARIGAFLDDADEESLTQRLLVPLFQRLGFYRVSPSGHQEKTLEYGKDLWMKYQLPTGHWIYFGAQVKREKLDARGNSADSNTATVLNQILMAIDHPIFDPDTGRKVLIDHFYVISAGEITRAARNWLTERLDISQRRQMIFMDREEFLNHAARILLDLQIDEPEAIAEMSVRAEEDEFEF